ncbi:MAG: sigma-54-dependent Fis family transcriptional regulator [Planctomycetes bacterium]|nr:sigma-54-dependent Fis family transcriptional regulator [Planctomycetota bacterium]
MTAAPNLTGLRHRRILVVDDELALRKGLAQRFEDEGAEVTTADTVTLARKSLKEGDFDLVVLDHRMPDGTGLALLEEQKRQGAAATFIMMTAYSSTEDAIRAMKAGAADYLLKPFDLDELVLVAERALENVALKSEVTRLRARAVGAGGSANIVGKSRAMAELRALVERVAASGARTILITGESGTGKDVVARAIHASSPEGGRPFLDITCTALPEALLESELFGHEKGAFTDAKSAKRGLFEEAEGGTIFLDEIGDMPLSLQAKLLRFLESKSFRRVGGLKEIKVDVRVIAATHRRLPELVATGQFRGDLYYRLNVIPIEIPPLKERPEDIQDLLEHFARHYSRELKKELSSFDAAALARLTRHPWPGNVRELRNCVERAVLLAHGPLLTVADLPPEMRRGDADPAVAAASGGPFILPERGVVLEDAIRSLLDQALVRTAGNKSRAATLLGVHRDQVRYWVKKYGLERWVRRKTKAEATR